MVRNPMMLADDFTDVYPLAPSQWSMWTSFGEAVLDRRTTVTLTLNGEIYPGAAAAIRDALCRHDALGIRFEVLPSVHLPVQRLATNDANLEIRASSNPDEFVIRFEALAAALDGYSITLLVEEIEALARGKALKATDLDWLDVLDWNDRRIRQRDRSTSIPEQMMELKPDRRVPSYEYVDLSVETAQALSVAAQTLEVKAEDLLIAALHILVAKCGPAYHQGVGRVLTGRPLSQMASVPGRLDILVPTEVQIDTQNGRELVARVVSARLDLQAQFDEDPFAMARSLVSSQVDFLPWFGVAVAASEQAHGRVPNIRVKTVNEDPGPCPILLSIEHEDVGLRLALRREIGLLPDNELEWLDIRIRTILGEFAADDNRSPLNWNLVGPLEGAWIDNKLTGIHVDIWPSVTVIESIRRVAEELPDTLAIIEGECLLTYGDLLRAADDLSARILSTDPALEAVVGLYTSSIGTFVVGALGIMISGCVFLPLDERIPLTRQKRLLEIGDSKVIVSDKTPIATVGSCTVIDLSNDSNQTGKNSGINPRMRAARPEGLAYAIATSGSTGEPKLVGVEHRNLAAYVQSIKALISMEVGTRVSTPALPTADLGYTTVFPALASGATLIGISDQARLDSDSFEVIMTRHGIDVLKITPSHLEALTAFGAATPRLPRKTLILGGEVASQSLLQRLRENRPDLIVVNHYGPTETTVGVLASVAAARTLGAQLAIGNPLVHVGARIVIAGVRAANVGIKGELRVFGAQVARGYLRDPRLTAERFRPAPSGRPGSREYITGDQAILGWDGQVQYCGRIDDQVKIRGFRVEPLEVQRELVDHPNVLQACVLVEIEGDRSRLVAFAVVDRPTPIADLRGHLLERLPEVFLPSAIHVVDQIWLGSSGKVDRAAMLRAVAPSATVIVPPRNDVERVLVAIWSELIGVNEISIDANVFDSGGHSLTVTQVASRLREYLAVDLTIDIFFSHPTIVDLAEFLLQHSQGSELHKRAAVAVQVLTMTDDEIAGIVGGRGELPVER